jgi:hypothetical protein
VAQRHVHVVNPTHAQPLRAMGAEEPNRLAAARVEGPFVAWRDDRGALHVHALAAGRPVTVGRSTDSTICFEHLLVSREHAEVIMRTRRTPGETSVFLLDLRSKHGTEQRQVELHNGAERAVMDLQQVPSQPTSPMRLEAGDHDVRLAGEVWIRIGGVRADPGATHERDDHQLPRPTPRERDVLVALCRPRFAAGAGPVAAPSNAQIAAAMRPRISPDRVSDLLSQLYRKYALHETKEQNRVSLVEIALKHRFVGPADYM